MEAHLIGILEKLWVVISIVAFWMIKELKKDNKERDSKISRIEKTVDRAENTFITDAHMKESIREFLEPYKQDQQEIKALLRELNEHVIELSKDMAVQNAIRKLDESKSTTSQ